ncbi:RidA family protein [Flavisphingomonas formosensis]|uniref:RidA family protein n=1 Tax=Flavisphingomonas formosensis TaxID=861534 RepID=UPI002FCD6B0D
MGSEHDRFRFAPGRSKVSAILALWCAMVASGLSVAATAQAPAAPPFRDGVSAGNLLFLSGQTGIVPQGQDPHGEGFDAAARMAMDKLGVALERHGGRFEDVVKCTVMLADIQDWPRFNATYQRYFTEGRLPARSAMGGLSLAHGAQVEVECIADMSHGGGGTGPAPRP